MVNLIKNNLRKFLSPVFIIFLLLAFALWYVNELRSDKTKAVEPTVLPVQPLQ